MPPAAPDAVCGVHCRKGILIIFLQKGTVNDIEEVLLMLRPVFLGQFSGYLGELSGKVIT